MAEGTLNPEPINNYGKIQTTRGGGRDGRGYEREPRRRVREELLDAVPVDDGIVPPTWTPDHVGRRLIDGFRILYRMPKISGPKEYGNGWPSIVRDADDLRGMSPDDRVEHLVRSAAKPTRLEITRKDIALSWLEELRGYDTGIALQVTYWADYMARRRNLRDLCKAKGWAYSTFKVKLGRGRRWIAEQLGARGEGVF
jgi:hypothetical protein